MNRFAVVGVALLFTAVAYAGSMYKYQFEPQVETRATLASDPPTATEKLDLNGVKKLRLTVCTCTTSACSARAPNQYLDGGYVDIWYNNPLVGWVPNPDLHLPIGQPTPASECHTWADIPSPGGNTGGQAVAVTRAVGVGVGDGGNYFSVMLEGISNE